MKENRPLYKSFLGMPGEGVALSKDETVVATTIINVMKTPNAIVHEDRIAQASKPSTIGLPALGGLMHRLTLFQIEAVDVEDKEEHLANKYRISPDTVRAAFILAADAERIYRRQVNAKARRRKFGRWIRSHV